MKILGNKRDRQWTRYMASGNQSHYKQFCKHRNKVKKLSMANRKQYERKLASQAKTNPKAIYKYINSRLKIQKEITEVHIDCDSTDSELTDNKKIIVDIFAKYFASIFNKDNNDVLPIIDNLPCDSPMDICIITEKMVSEQLQNLDITKSPGPDCINARLLKELHDAIVKPLTNLFNNSLKQKIVPHEWKKAHVAPIHKKREIKYWYLIIDQ